MYSLNNTAVITNRFTLVLRKYNEFQQPYREYSNLSTYVENDLDNEFYTRRKYFMSRILGFVNIILSQEETLNSFKRDVFVSFATLYN